MTKIVFEDGVPVLKKKKKYSNKDGKKVHVTVRLDREVYQYYRATGPGYTRRINNDLKKMMRERTTDE